VAGTISTRVNKGYLVQLHEEGADMAFLPRTHAVRPPSGDWDALVGIDGQFKIINLDRTSGNIVVSQSGLLAWEVSDHLAVGQVIEGSIAEIGEYYLSVDLGGVEGRLHKDHLLDSSMDALSSRFETGQSILVQVKKLDLDKRQIQLVQALNPEQQRARHALLESLIPGQVIRGTITRIVVYGLFVDIGGIRGLLHRTKLIDPSEGNLKERFQKSQSILVEVQLVDVERERVGFGEAVNPV
jgi:small subunit ribosomal protein S1